MKPRTKKILLGIAVFQLILVSFGAASFNPFRTLSYFGRGVEMYADVTGASTEYSFFAPGVASQLRARFEVKDAAGSTQIVKMEQGEPKEAELRVGNIIGAFWKDRAPDPKLKRSLAASWAGKVFARHNLATQVKVILESYELVSMQQYREGKRGSWKPFYQATFQKKQG